MMNCPKCENELREDMFCENCNEYLFNMDKDKKSDIAKSWLKVFGITVGCFALLICILIGVLTISDSHKYNEELNSKYEEICQYISDNNYQSALNCLEIFKKDYSDKKKAVSKINELNSDIEIKLYESRNFEDSGIANCELYLEYYPNGKYENEIKQSLLELSEKEAVKNIDKATSYIQKNDVLNADSILQEIVNNTYVSEDTKKQANDLINSISSKVADAKGKTAILGTWKKETGVQYIFEDNGHMSVSLSSDYNNQLGTTLDGMEVNSLLSEINDFSPVVRGGTWKYIGTDTNGSEPVYTYSLFYYGSQYRCIIPVDSAYKMGIYLSSGIGDMSILTK